MHPRLLISFGLLALTGCNPLLKSAYGIKEPKELTDTQIEILSGKLGILPSESFVLDRSFFSYLKQYDSVKTTDPGKCSPMISKYQQPLQVYYFDESGNLVSFHNNCNTGGFPKLNWNNDHQFDVFIPKTTIPITDTALSFSRIAPFVRPLAQNKQMIPAKSTILVLWCGFMKKQSKELFRVVRENQKLDENNSSKIYYVNIDNYFTGNTR